MLLNLSFKVLKGAKLAKRSQVIGKFTYTMSVLMGVEAPFPCTV
jgi:hypothetical protein